jgi:uncharacterized protein (DUF952 family)
VRLTYHGTPAEYFDGLAQDEPYLPADFGRDGFIHCTNGERRLADVLSEFYRETAGEWLVLYIDLDLVTAPVRYDDPDEVFPHIYGPLNRDAIVAVRQIGRMADGRFLLPPRLER